MRHPPLAHEAGSAAPPSPPGFGGNAAIHAIVPLPTDYKVELDITPGFRIVEHWASIVHFTATLSNCCEYGDRIPGAHCLVCFVLTGETGVRIKTGDFRLLWL